MVIPKEQLQLIEQLLNLPGVRVLDADIAEREMTIQIETTDDCAICHKCGQKATEFYCDGEALRLRHLPVFNRRVYLSYRPKRYRCLHCDDRPTTTRRDDWYDAKAGVTRAFAQFLLLEIVGSTPERRIAQTSGLLRLTARPAPAARRRRSRLESVYRTPRARP